jgi:5-methylcytosine-specific restriction endonuclease McrA
MKNPRITKKEQGLLKGALRRVFSRSELRRAVIDAALVEYSDPSRPRVKKWCRCAICKLPEAKSYVAVDHISPVIPLDRSFEEMSIDEVVNRLWCLLDNLQVLCETCHDDKTAEERKARKKIKDKLANE